MEAFHIHGDPIISKNLELENQEKVLATTVICHKNNEENIEKHNSNVKHRKNKETMISIKSIHSQISDFTKKTKILREDNITNLYKSVLSEDDRKEVEEYIEKNRYFTTEYFYRFVILFLHSLSNFSVGLAWLSFSTISERYTEIFHVSKPLNSLNTNSYSLAYIILIFPSCFIIEKKSVNLCVVICTLSLALGSFLRIFTEYNVLYSFVGQFLCAISQPFVFNSNAKIVATWFRSERRLLATSFLFLINTVGVVVSEYLPIWCFSSNSSDEIWKQEFNEYIRIPCYISGVSALLNLLLFKEKPDIPPSISSLIKINEKEEYDHINNNLEKMSDSISEDSENEFKVQENNNSESLLQQNNDINKANKIIINNNHDLKTSDNLEVYEIKVGTNTISKSIFENTAELFKSRNFCLLLTNFTIYVGFFTYFFTLLNDFLKTYNIPAEQANKYSSTGNLASIPINLVVVFVSGKFIKPKTLLVMMNLIMIIVYILLTLFLDFKITKNEVCFYIIFCCIGGILNCNYIGSIDLACEITYPIDESLSSGILFVFSQLFGYILTYPFSYMITNGWNYLFNIIIILLFIISLFCTAFIKGKKSL